MNTIFKSIGLCAMVALCVGCPRLDVQYTNADTSSSGFWGNLLGGLAVDDAGDGGETGTETREVVEPDVIRRDGNILYVLNQYRGLTLVDLDTEAVLAQVPTYGYPRDLYLANGRAYVLVGYASEYTVENGVVGYDVASRLYVVDIADPNAPTVAGTFALEGDLVDSRLVGDVLYAVCAKYEWYYTLDGEDGVAVATTSGAEERVKLVKAQTSSSWVTSVNVADPASVAVADEESFDGLGDIIQATDYAIFVADSDWSGGTATITYVDISDPAGAIEVRGTMEVPGEIADQYKLDAYDGALRVVSGTWDWSEWGSRTVYVTTFDLADPDNLVQLGQVEVEQPDDSHSLYATRFDGPRGYIVTYFQMDPLYIIDLSDPANPAVTGELEVPGWSTHIEPQGDRLIALGVDDTDGQRRVCVSLFDVSDPAAPGLVDRVSMGGDWSWSSAYSDVKAFTVLDDVLIVPFSGWTSDFGGYERLQFITYTADDLAAQGYVDLDGGILRSFEYGGSYYGVTTEQLATIDGSDLASPVVANTVMLAEYVASFFELSEEAGAEVIVKYDAGKTVVRTCALADMDTPLASVELDVGSFVAAHADGALVAVVGTDWDETSSFYRVAVVDCSDAAGPVAGEVIRVDVAPYSSWWWGWGYYPELVDKSAKQYLPWYPYYSVSDTTFVAGGRIALRYADYSENILGQWETTQGVALVDLDAESWDGSTVEFGTASVVSVNQAGDALYVCTIEDAGSSGFNPLCAHFVQELDVAAGTLGSEVNVPGAFVQLDKTTNIMTCRDDQWQGGEVETRLTTVAWNAAGPVETVDTAVLPDSSYDLLAAGSRIFVGMPNYTTGKTYLYVVRVGGDGALAIDAGRLISNAWAYLLDGQDSVLYATIGNAIACYDFTAGGALAYDPLQVMSTPSEITFGANQAYAALGYSGLAVLPY